MSRRHVRTRAMLAAAALVVTTLGAIGGSSVEAAVDTTPPKVWAVKTPKFVIGSQITTYAIDVEPPYYYSAMPLKLRWNAKDPSGICGYSLWEVPTGAAPFPIFEDEMIKHYVVPGNEYNGDFGGGATLTAGWAVTATDCEGNTSEPMYMPNLPRTLQDDNTTSAGAPGSIAYAGPWQVSNCTCWSGGTTHKTWKKGAKASYTATFDKGEHVALVMATGPKRGKAKVFVDGVYRTTIDTWAPHNRARVVVWQGWMPAGEHTVKVINKATPGRARIDLDAVVVSRLDLFD